MLKSFRSQEPRSVITLLQIAFGILVILLSSQAALWFELGSLDNQIGALDGRLAAISMQLARISRGGEQGK